MLGISIAASCSAPSKLAGGTGDDEFWFVESGAVTVSLMAEANAQRRRQLLEVRLYPNRDYRSISIFCRSSPIGPAPISSSDWRALQLEQIIVIQLGEVQPDGTLALDIGRERRSGSVNILDGDEIFELSHVKGSPFMPAAKRLPSLRYCALDGNTLRGR